MTSITSRLLEIVEKYPEQIAIVCDNNEISYLQLGRKIRHFAKVLVRRGVAPEVRIGLCIGPSIDLIVAMLAILEAGGAYVPLDPETPSERLKYLIDDVRPTFILTDEQHSSKLTQARFDRDVLCVNFRDLEREVELNPNIHSPIVPHPDNLAYVIYTSGSTGGPKGNLITHRNVLRLFSETDKIFEFTDSEVWPLLHSFAFDFSVWEIFGALLYGGKLVIPTANEIRDPAQLLEFLTAHNVTILNFTPSYFSRFSQFLIREREGMREKLQPSYIVFGGERLDFSMLNTWYSVMGDRTVLVNMYGITETTVHVTAFPIDRSAAESEATSVIGLPISDLKLYVLDESLEQVPTGAPGELYVAGPGLARGYNNRSHTTAESFLPCPFDGMVGQRMYRTGDLVRVNREGQLVYLSRQGGYVKIRGFRVSLHEIEFTLQNHDCIQRAVVLPREHNGSIELDAWLLWSETGRVINLEELRAFLSEKIPSFMIPHRFFGIGELPITINGKVDVEKLRTTGHRLASESSCTIELSASELHMLAIWRHQMEQNEMSASDDFFASGGDSIRSVELVIALRNAGWDVSVQDLWFAPTVRQLNERIRLRPQLSQMQSLAQPTPMSEASDMQTMMLDKYRLHSPNHNGVYHPQQSFTLRSNEKLDLDLLKNCCQMECESDPSFRMRFIERNGTYYRHYEEDLLVQISHYDFSKFDSDEVILRLHEHELNDLAIVFDPMVSRTALTRVALFKLTDTEIRVFISAHHAVDDGWGRHQFLKRVLAAYKSKQPQRARSTHDIFAKYVALQKSQAVNTEAIEFWGNYRIATESLTEIDRQTPRSFQSIQVSLNQRIVQNIIRLAKSEKVQIKAVFLAATLEAISCMTNMHSITIGMIVNGRLAELPEAMTANGLYWNMHPFTWMQCEEAVGAVREIHGKLATQSEFALFPLSEILAEKCSGKEFRYTFNFTSFPEMFDDNSVSTFDWKGMDIFHFPINISVNVGTKEDSELRITLDPHYFDASWGHQLLNQIVHRIGKFQEHVIHDLVASV